MGDLFGLNTAVFSPCRTWRYELWRRWDVSRPTCVFVGLNPSTADETTDDNTIRRCITYAREWGFGSLCMLNLFAFRATKPSVMRRVEDPVGPDNDATLERVCRDAGLVVAAWGVHGTHRNRAGEVVNRNLLGEYAVLDLTRDGIPGHPLYLPKTLVPVHHATHEPVPLPKEQQMSRSPMDGLTPEDREAIAAGTAKAADERERFAADALASFDRAGLSDDELEELDADCLRRWQAGETLPTIDLRGAAIAADRQGDTAAAREISGEIDVREAQGQTS